MYLFLSEIPIHLIFIQVFLAPEQMKSNKNPNKYLLNLNEIKFSNNHNQVLLFIYLGHTAQLGEL